MIFLCDHVMVILAPNCINIDNNVSVEETKMDLHWSVH